jgi:hypothetical protein
MEPLSAELLDELARVFAHAALEELVREISAADPVSSNGAVPVAAPSFSSERPDEPAS